MKTAHMCFKTFRTDLMFEWDKNRWKMKFNLKIVNQCNSIIVDTYHLFTISLLFRFTRTLQWESSIKKCFIHSLSPSLSPCVVNSIQIIAAHEKRSSINAMTSDTNSHATHTGKDVDSKRKSQFSILFLVSNTFRIPIVCEVSQWVNWVRNVRIFVISINNKHTHAHTSVIDDQLRVTKLRIFILQFLFRASFLYFMQSFNFIACSSSTRDR